jgi:uncharacterized protein (TIGR02265 family)
MGAVIDGRIIPARTFESILRALKPGDELRDELVAAGYDPRTPQDHYPVQAWRAVLEVMRRHRFPNLPSAEGDRALGHAFLDGFAETIVGRVICVMLPLIGAERMLISFPRYASYGRPDGRIEMKAEGERRWRAQIEMPHALPCFTAGVLERGLQRTGVEGAVDVENHAGDRFDLLARW